MKHCSVYNWITSIYFFVIVRIPMVPIEEVVWTMHNLIQQGKILYWGTSQWSGAEIMEAHRVAQQYDSLALPWNSHSTICLIGIKWRWITCRYLKMWGSVLPSGVRWLQGFYRKIPGRHTRRFQAGHQGFDWLKDRWLQEEKISKLKKLVVLARSRGFHGFPGHCLDHPKPACYNRHPWRNKKRTAYRKPQSTGSTEITYSGSDGRN